MQKFKIFYSWQSDLPGNKTKNFIRECIDEAIDLAQESEAFEAERDEATTGTTGSPNIVTTLFSKIDNCDLFIADLSLCFTEDRQNEKKSPNPNVLLELGYAVKTLGWDRVICLCNTDYGDKYPFDIAHNRITDFSLEGKSKKEVKSDIAKIIFINIRDLRKQLPRAKKGLASHIIGAYDFEDQKVINSLVPIEISKQEGYVLHNKELLEKARNLILEIQELTDRIKTVKGNNEKLQVNVAEQPEPTVESQSQFSSFFPNKATEIAVTWKDTEDDQTLIKRWFDIDVSDDFFNLGRLKRMVQFPNSTLNGTNDEKTKYEKLQKLSYNLNLLEVRTNYLKTFEGMYFVPLAIQNISSMQDTDIRVVVNVKNGEIVEPEENLIWDEFEGLQGHLCRDDEDENDVGIICELFALREDGVICIEDPPYDPSRHIPKIPILTATGFSQPNKTKDDYRQELEEFVASTGGRGYYEFNVTSLRPGECRWLCYGMLIRPVDGKVVVHYQIYSKNSLGDLSDTLEMKIS